jgi:peptidyl-prolyl cis-trans isomerase SurA
MKEMRVKNKLKQFPSILLLATFILSGSFFGYSEIIEKIYAVVNGETITYSDLKATEMEMMQMLAQQYKGEELAKQVEDLKKNLLEMLIDKKLVLSHAKLQNYDVSGEVEMVIKNLKEENNIKSDDELKRALAAQGMDYESWKKQLTERRLERRYIMENVGSKIKIDNSAIMEYYKKNIKEYTLPMKFSLNCIFIDKTKYQDNEAGLQERKNTINAALNTPNANFIEIAKKYSELPGVENNYHLGEFKKGELDSNIEAASENLKDGEHSSWIETENGWYLTQMEKRTEPQLIEYKKVRSDIEMRLIMAEQDVLLKDYMVELKKESHIKVYEEYYK